MFKLRLNELKEEIREINTLNGWNVWQPEDFDGHPYKFGAIIALIQSEASEALEWYRQMDKTGTVINDKIMKDIEILRMLNYSPGTHQEAKSWLERIKQTHDQIESNEDIVALIKEEMADIIIRCLDWWGGYDDDPAVIIQAKLAKNRTRGERHGGKKI